MLFDITINPGNKLYWNIDSSVQRKRVLRQKKIATVQGPTMYYHWVMDRMPSIFLMKDLILADREIQLIINAKGRVPSYVYEYLDLLGITQNQRFAAQSDAIYHADTLYFATPFLMEPIPKNLLLAMRDHLISAALKKTSATKYKDNLIVIIQRSEPTRKIKNLSDVVTRVQTLFADKKCDIVVFEGNKSVIEQIELFYHAKLIIGVVGSGLANIIYAKKDTPVIEIHPAFDQHVVVNGEAKTSGYEFVWWIASAMDLNHWVLPVDFRPQDDEYLICPLIDLTQMIEEIKDKHF